MASAHPLSEDVRKLVKATAPVLKEHGVTLTSNFYARMLTGNPELKNVFNQAHQKSGSQQQALAGAVAAYAEHIDNLAVLSGAVSHIAHRHAALGIRAEHYPIVGKHLIAAIKEVLGEAATPELVDAWAKAYGLLADILIGAEQKLYTESATKEGGWSMTRAFRVFKKVKESEDMVSLYMRPSDGGKCASFLPGQYITVRAYVEDWKVYQPRHYSLSEVPNSDYYRITVKREDARGDKPQGHISHYIHDVLKEGDIIELNPPFGDCVIDAELNESKDPVVLISAGSGTTPFICMAKALINHNSARTVRWLQGCQDGEHFPFQAEVEELCKKGSNFQKRIYFSEPKAEDDGKFCAKGLISFDDKETVSFSLIGEPNVFYYLCGPTYFMKTEKAKLIAAGVSEARIRIELFGTGNLDQKEN